MCCYVGPKACSLPAAQQEQRCGRQTPPRSLACRRSQLVSWLVLLTAVATVPVAYAAEYIQDKNQCLPPRIPTDYGNITSLPPTTFKNCLVMPIEELLVNNREVGYVGIKTISDTVEVVLLSEARGSLQYLEVVSEGDMAFWDVSRRPKRSFRGHSCLNRDQFCGVVSVMPTMAGFVAIDRHRIVRFSFTWLSEKQYERMEFNQVKCTAGQEVETREECEKAVQQITEAAERPASQLMDTTAFPCFCSMGSDNTAYFNLRTSGCNNRADVAPVCVQETQIIEDDLVDKITDSYGEFNRASLDPYGNTSLLFPSQAAEWSPFSATHLSEDFQITPFFPTMFAMSKLNIQPHYFFVTDTGNHRVVMIDATKQDVMEFVDQFGITGMPSDGRHGLNWPIGIAVAEPFEEKMRRRVLANVYVVDQRNDRLVKLSLMDTSRGHFLEYSTDYGSAKNVKGGQRGLAEPSGVSTFRHYIFVAEIAGNAITVLMVDYRDPQQINFVTHMQPAVGMKLTGHLAVSSRGYIWYTALNHPGTYVMGTMYLSEELRRSTRPTLLADFRSHCMNQSWMNQYLRVNETMYNKYMYDALSLTQLNFRFADWLPEGMTEDDELAYVTPRSFNRTRSFNFERFNKTVYDGEMVFCEAPPEPTSPPMMSGNSGGWVGNAGGQGVSLGAADRQARPFLVVSAVAVVVALHIVGLR
eukprot:TRINITY_DN21497_c0_g1_i1.p1 TRINITY_DN21497_c0_g1~~TRINITY_DN21497_c0_g1_i1.p1  ORF type:complete len:696 (+),score=113.50 TRINITY_DN21497_c0_g1_i1:127-2214(+)